MITAHLTLANDLREFIGLLNDSPADGPVYQPTQALLPDLFSRARRANVSRVEIGKLEFQVKQLVTANVMAELSEGQATQILGDLRTFLQHNNSFAGGIRDTGERTLFSGALGYLQDRVQELHEQRQAYVTKRLGDYRKASVLISGGVAAASVPSPTPPSTMG